jgi:hypothetical protein
MNIEIFILALLVTVGSCKLKRFSYPYHTYAYKRDAGDESQRSMITFQGGNIHNTKYSIRFFHKFFLF